VIIGIDASRAALAHHTGTETYAYQLLLAMMPLVSADLQLRLYTHQAPQPKRWPASPFVETRIIPFPRLWTHLRLAVELSLQPPDVLFVPAHVLPLFCPVPAVVTIHDLGYRYYPEAHPSFQRRYLDWTTRRHTRVATHLIADSATTRDDLIHHYQADPQKISVVHLGRDPGMDNARSLHDCPAVRERYGLKAEYLLYVGTLQPRKNLLRLVEAFAMIAPDYPGQLVLAGRKGWLYDEIFERVQQLNLGERVKFPGFIPEEDKAALIRGARLYLYPSLYEGFGLPLLEAMACGTPILTSNLSSMPEIVGEAALLVDPHQVEAIAGGIKQLLFDPALCQRLVQRGFERLAIFSWSKAAEQTLDILIQAASARL
jgi:glycosyltransferase involved in cell wall biosynthesis